jgi:hypothetical protein
MVARSSQVAGFPTMCLFGRNSGLLVLIQLKEFGMVNTPIHRYKNYFTFNLQISRSQFAATARPPNTLLRASMEDALFGDTIGIFTIQGTAHTL